MKRLHAVLTAGMLVGFLPSCQTANPSAPRRSMGSAAASHLEQAREAWQTMQRMPPGTLPDQSTLRQYNHAVLALVQSLRAHEGTATWGKPIRLGGTHPRELTFESPAEAASTKSFPLAEFSRCRIATDVKLEGFDQLVAHDGLGVPVVLEQSDPRRVGRPFHPPDGEFLPATAVLEFPSPVTGHPPGAHLRFYDPLAVADVAVGPHRQRLAENVTAALQCSLTNDGPSRQTLRGRPPSASGEVESGLFFLNRYDATKTPVVFAHGMLSGPEVWKNAVNGLLADPVLRRRYQPVCFAYPSKLSVPASAARLRQLLKRSRRQLDPAHHNDGFGRIALVGHSMGGLVTRMQGIDSGTEFWRAFFSAAPETVAGRVDAGTMETLRSALLFQREPDVDLLVFISTPHRGAELADNSVLRAAMRLILFLPTTAKNRLKALVSLPPAYIHPVLRDFHAWGLEGTENLSPEHPFFKALAKRPISIPFHSIIATRSEPDLHQSSDGVVPYASAHLAGAASETTVPYGHGCLEKPQTVQAVLDILRKAR